MFDKFQEEFQIADIETNNLGISINCISDETIGFREFMNKYSGTTFSNGLYRIFTLEDIDKWTKIAIGAFPLLRGRIKCFGFDWLGRLFALDYERLKDYQPLILMLEPGTGEILEIPTTFLDFHEEELIEEKDAALAESFFQEWYQHSKESINYRHCVGYKVPLFLGGEDTIENLELVDMDVYWGISSQLLGE